MAGRFFFLSLTNLASSSCWSRIFDRQAFILPNAYQVAETRFVVVFVVVFVVWLTGHTQAPASRTSCVQGAGQLLRTGVGVEIRTISLRWNEGRWKLGRKSCFGSVGSLWKMLNGCLQGRSSVSDRVSLLAHCHLPVIRGAEGVGRSHDAHLQPGASEREGGHPHKRGRRPCNVNPDSRCPKSALMTTRKPSPLCS